MINPMGLARGSNQFERVAEVKRWVEDVFDLADGVTVFVTELRCGEPGCPPVETVIAILRRGHGSETTSFKLPKPLALVTLADVTGLRSQLPTDASQMTVTPEK